MTGPNDPLRHSQDAATTPVGVNTLCPQCGLAMPAFETRCSGCGHHKEPGSEAEQRELLRRRLQNGIGTAFELLEMLGKGGMGVVFRAREKSLDRDVALKVLAFDPLMAPEAFARFEREAKLAARLDHPNIVPIFAVGQGQGVAYYTMRIVRGGSLEDLLTREKKLEPARAIKYLREIAAALDHAHAHNIVHRDIKPANVMLGDGDHVFVADFGIARAVGGEAALTSTGVVGSPAYMAPEQWQGQGIDGRADQYAFGILAYELLTGKRPYRDATMQELLRLHLTEALPDITKDFPLMAGSVRDTLARATAKEPADRFASTTEFVTTLERALMSKPTPAQSAETIVGAPTPVTVAGRDLSEAATVVTPRAPAAPAPAMPGVRPSAPPPPPSSSTKNRMIPVGAAVLVIGGSAFAWWMTHKSASVAPQTSAALPSAAVANTVFVKSPTDTVRLQSPVRHDTVTVQVPAPPAGASASSPPTVTAGGAAPSAPPGGAPGVAPTSVAPSRGAAQTGFVAIMHPLIPDGRYFIDGVSIAPKTPPIYEVSAGRHIVSFKTLVPTMPEIEMLRVAPGDTARAQFLPVSGGGARGDQLRALLQERMRRSPQNFQLPQRGGNPAGQRGRGRGSDTLGLRGK